MNPVAVLRTIGGGGAILYVWCPGCDDLHGIGVPAPDGSIRKPNWSWNGSLDAPHCDPSIKVTYAARDEEAIGGPRPERICHSYLHGGKWTFLADCWHELRGSQSGPRVVEMVPLPDWIARDER